MVRKSTIGGLESKTQVRFNMLKFSHRLNNGEGNAETFMVHLLDLYQENQTMDSNLKEIIGLFKTDRHFKKAIIEFLELHKQSK